MLGVCVSGWILQTETGAQIQIQRVTSDIGPNDTDDDADDDDETQHDIYDTCRSAFVAIACKQVLRRKCSCRLCSLEVRSNCQSSMAG